MWKYSILTAGSSRPQCSGQCKTSPCDWIVGGIELFVALSVTQENNFISLCLYFPYSKMKIKTFIHPSGTAGVCKTLRSPWIEDTREDQIISFYSRIHAFFFIHSGLFSQWIYLGPEATRAEGAQHSLKITYGLLATSMMSHSLQGNWTVARTIGIVIFLNKSMN